MMFKKKKKTENTINIKSDLAAKIPYICGYEEEGVIETSPGKFSKGYTISDIKVKDNTAFDSEIAIAKIEALINSFPANMECQFVVHNKLIEQKSYLKKVLKDPEKRDEVLRPYVKTYNDVIVDNIDIGHNNVKKDIYFIISVKADVVDDAVAVFRQVDGDIRDNFHKVYGIDANPMSLIERLHVLYTIFNIGEDKFYENLDINGNGNATLANLKYLKMTTKDAVSPKTWDTSIKLLDYSVFNLGTDKEQYARVFFINSLPSVISQSMISDLTNISSSMLFSTIYEPVNADVGFGEAKDLVAKNTVITQHSRRDTVAQRKNKEKVTIENNKVMSEQTYFEKEALNVFKEAKASDSKVMKCTFTVVLFAGDLETLNRDSELLRISAAKFAASVKSLDLLQLQGFQTSLPLCDTRIDCARIMDINRLSRISPVNIQDITKKNGLFMGLNAINDNLIFLNRKNNINLNGIIAGAEHSGKTYQSKREIFNALISTQDRINIITDNDEYDDFVQKMGGKIVTGTYMDPFEKVQNYGLTKDDFMLKAYFLEAYVNVLNAGSISIDIDDDDDKHKKQEDIESEINTLVGHLKENDLTDTQDVLEYISSNRAKYPYTSSALSKMSDDYGIDSEETGREERLILYKVKTDAEILLALDYLWNRTIEEKKKNMSNWIFVDPVDPILQHDSVSDYLSEYMTNTNLLQTILTFVVQNSVQLLTTPSTTLNLEEMVQNTGYAKLLNMGPIERKKYIELLNISNALVPYISNVEPGKGIIITSASNITFDDNFLEPDNPFRKIFSKEVEQIRYMVS